MSLDWNVREVADWETVCRMVAEFDDPSRGIEKGQTIWNPRTEAMAWLLLFTGLGKITEDNAARFYARAAAWEAIHGALLSSSKGDHRITLDDVLAHIGMTSNVYDAETPKKYEDKLTRAVQERIDRKAKAEG